jgi:hypothetical protein
MMTLLSGWARYSRICHRRLLAQSPSIDWLGLVVLTQVVCCRMTSLSMSPTQLPFPDLKMYWMASPARKQFTVPLFRPKNLQNLE